MHAKLKIIDIRIGSYTNEKWNNKEKKENN